MDLFEALGISGCLIVALLTLRVGAGSLPSDAVLACWFLSATPYLLLAAEVTGWVSGRVPFTLLVVVKRNLLARVHVRVGVGCV